MIEFLIIIGAMIEAAGIAAVSGIYTEKNLFNNGKCKHCNEPLKLFDYDSHGGRGYECPLCAHTVWVSYNSVDKKYRRKND